MTITQVGQFEIGGLLMGPGTDYTVLAARLHDWPANRAERRLRANTSGAFFDTEDLFSYKTAYLQILIK